MSLAVHSSTLEEKGFVWARRFAAADVLEELARGIAEIPTESNRAGIRDLMRRCPVVRSFAQSARVLDFLEALLGHRPFAVRGILFDKTPVANWSVAWHQDQTIAVTDRREVAGFGPWSVKDRVPHVQPPVELLERMLTLRLHLDPTDEQNGALQVIAGTHRLGRLNSEAINECERRGTIQTCVAQEGDALLMRPLLLHSSSPASSPKHRRVIHVEFAAEELSGGLAWAERASV